MKKILVILGHPNKKSFNGAIFDSYIKGAKVQGHQVRSIELGQLKFDPILRYGFAKNQPLEPDLIKAQQDILWANHLVFIYPIWWGTYPALLKGFIDRVFQRGFSHRYNKDGSFDKLLTGKSAHIITTMDSPLVFDQLILHSAGSDKLLKKAVFEFCGITPTKITRISQLRKYSEEQKKQVLNRIILLTK